VAEFLKVVQMLRVVRTEWKWPEKCQPEELLANDYLRFPDLNESCLSCFHINHRKGRIYLKVCSFYNIIHIIQC